MEKKTCKGSPYKLCFGPNKEYDLHITNIYHICSNINQFHKKALLCVMTVSCESEYKMSGFSRSNRRNA